MSEYLVVSEEELRDADAMLAGVPDIEVCPPVKTYKGHRGKLIEQDNPPWVKLSVTFRDQWMKKLKGSKLPVFLSIALHIDKDGQSFPGLETIAEETGYSTREITRAIAELEELGFLEVRRVFKDKIHRRNFYTVKAMVSYGYSNPVNSIIPPESSKSTLSPLDVKSSEETPRQKSHEVEPLRRTIKKDSSPQEILQTEHSSPAKEDTSNMTTIEERKRRTEKALLASMTTSNKDYAQYPEDVRPVLDRVERLWYLRAPARPKKGGGQYAFWIESSRELLDACAEFGVSALDALHTDWDIHMNEHGGVAPHTASNPGSLVNSMRSKAALMRSGNTAPMWGNKRGEQPARQTRLDV